MNEKSDFMANHQADKEEAIVDLICTQLAEISGDAADMAQVEGALGSEVSAADASAHDVIVIARSAASPVMTALVRLNEKLSERGIAVRAIITHRGPGDGLSAWLEQGTDLSFARSVNLLVDKRFHEAHEQLAFGDLSCWTGDSTRRPPGKSDAYQRMSTDCARTVAWARSCFDRLWQASEPLAAIPAKGDDELADGEPAAACTIVNIKGGNSALAATRH